TSLLFLLKRDIDLWNRCSHLIWLQRVLGKPTCDGLGGPFPIEPGTALGTDHHNQTEFERNVLQNSAIALGERAGLVLRRVVRSIHGSDAQFAVNSPEQKILPQIRPSSDVRQRVGRAASSIQGCDLFRMSKGE